MVFFYMGVWASYLFDLWGDLGGNMFFVIWNVSKLLFGLGDTVWCITFA